MAVATGRPAGRPPKPVEVKRSNGNPGGRPLPPAPMPGEGLAASGSVPVSPPLGADGADLWEQVWAAGGSWLSPHSDYQIVVMLCHAHDEAEECRRLLSIGEVPRYYTLPNGSVVTHPVVNQLKELRVQITSWLSALGFSPSDRARLGLGEVRQADALDELQKRRAERRAQEAI
jgi:P27 family predicted phage terminase small subunit